MRTVLKIVSIILCLYAFAANASESSKPKTEEDSKKASAILNAAAQLPREAQLDAVYNILFKKTHLNGDGTMQGPGLPDELTRVVCDDFIDERIATQIPIHYKNALIKDVKLSPDKSFLVISYFNGDRCVTILKDRVSGNQIGSLADDRRGKVTISPTCTHIATCGQPGYEDYAIYLWEKNSGTKVQTFAGHEQYSKACRFSADASHLASIGDEGTVKLWDVETGQCLQTEQHGDHSWVQSVDISDEGNLLLSGGETSRGIDCMPAIKVWDVRSGHCEKIIPTKENINALQFIPADTSFVSAEDFSGKINRWNIAQDKPVCTFDHTMAQSIALSRKGNYMVSGGAIRLNPSNYVHVWNVNTGSCLHKFDIGDGIGVVEAVDISADGELITAVGNHDSSVKVWTKQDMHTLFKLVHNRIRSTEKSDKEIISSKKE